jgi:hypothetical protein
MLMADDTLAFPSGRQRGGLSNSKVANELFDSASSAKVHHVPVYSKLGVTAAVAAALVSLLLPVNSKWMPGVPAA